MWGRVTDEDAPRRLLRRLRALYTQAGSPTYERLVRAAAGQYPPVSLKYATLSNWLNGVSVPNSPHNFAFLVGWLERAAAERTPGWRGASPRAWEQVRQEAARQQRLAGRAKGHQADAGQIQLRNSARSSDSENADRNLIIPHSVDDQPIILQQYWSTPPRLAGFAGRAVELSQISERFNKGATVVALHGIGGVGKTQSAIEYAYTFRHRYSIVYWINAEQNYLIRAQMAKLALNLNVTPPNGGNEEEAAQALIRSLSARTDWLIIADNAEDPQAVAPLLQCTGGNLLITSRNPEWHEFAERIHIEIPPLGDAVEFLRRPLPNLKRTEAESLARAVGCLPLAMAQCAGLISSTGIPPHEYLQLLRVKTTALMATAAPYSYSESLMAVVELLAENVANADQAAYKLLLLSSFMGPERIPTKWFSGASDLGAGSCEADLWPWAAIGTLSRLGALEVGYGGIVVHRLTQAMLRRRCSVEESSAFYTMAVSLLCDASPGDPDDSRNWPTWAQLLPHVEALSPESTDSANLRELMCHGLRYLLISGQPKIALEWAVRLRESWATLHGAGNRDTLACSHRLAHAHYLIGEYEESCNIYDEILAHYKSLTQATYDSDPEILSAMNGRAANLHALGQYPESRRLFRDILANRQRILGLDHRETLRSMNSLGNSLRAVGLYAEALPYFDEAYTRRTRLFGESHPDTLMSANNLANNYQALGDHERALSLFEDILGRCAKSLGEKHPETLRTLSNIANSMYCLGRIDESEARHRHLVEHWTSILGRGHPDTLYALNDLANDLTALGFHAEALPLHRECAERRSRVLGDDHPDSLQSQFDLAEGLIAAGKMQSGMILHRQVLRRRRQSLGPDHIATRASLKRVDEKG